MPEVTSRSPLCVQADAYRLTCAKDRPYVYLETPGGVRIAELFVASGVNAVGALDDTVSLDAWQVHEEADAIVLSIAAVSSAWRRKVYRFECLPDRLRYQIEVTGTGQVTDVHYFGGHASANLRWGSGFFWSGATFASGFNPEPTTEERYAFGPFEGAVIDASGVPIIGRDGWFFTPPPFCFAFAFEGGWLGMGVEAAPGQNRFNELHYRTQRNAFHLTLPFEGYTEVAGAYRLPAIGFDFAEGPYQALERHVSALHDRHLAPVQSGRPSAEWWRRPIFCGWGAQCHLAKQDGGHAPSYARQHHYERFVATLEEHGVAPGILVLDDKWQQTYGENRVDPDKWPDLEGFIAKQHRAGRKVLLWLKAWDPEGVPVEECVTNAAGMPVSVDPTNPAFEERFRRSIRNMLGPDGYDADGFKLDFTARIPSSPGLRRHGEPWGLELMKRYLEILYSEAKQTKEDALVMTHTPHPYLSDVLDMIRLNDINTAREVGPAMEHRARIGAIACPNAVIDTDNWPMPDKATWRRYVEQQPELGVPSLYFVTHIDATGEALGPEDYRLVRETWERHRRHVENDLRDGPEAGARQTGSRAERV